MDSYDYIVVGGGSAGCAAAGELAADPRVTVLLLECGAAAEDNPETLRADGYKQAFINDAVMWDRLTVPQPACAKKRIYAGTGRGIGGSGAVNAMMYLRGAAIDFEMWNTAGWRWQDVEADFLELEAKLGLSQQPVNAFSEACLNAAEQAGFRRKADLNDGDLHGVIGYQQMNFRGANRRNSYVALIKDQQRTRSNLQIKTNTRARRVEFDAEQRVCGVEYDHGSTRKVVQARREVILAAGALETPRLLMLSGIGPAADLSALGIDVRVDQPCVGRNLHDHPSVILFFHSRQPVDPVAPTPYGFHRANPDSDLPEEAADTCYVCYPARSSLREGMMRLLPPMLLPQALQRRALVVRGMRGALGALFDRSLVKREIERVYGIVVVLGKPKSRGSVRLDSADIDVPGRVDPAYLTDPEDLETLVRGVDLARRMGAADALAAFGNTEIFPGRLARSPRQIASFVRRNVVSVYHFAGTCRMGDDEGSVVDGRLRVRGVTGLRVADASVIPTLPVAAINAPSMLIGCRAAHFAHQEWANTRNAGQLDTTRQNERARDPHRTGPPTDVGGAPG